MRYFVKILLLMVLSLFTVSIYPSMDTCKIDTILGAIRNVQGNSSKILGKVCTILEQVDSLSSSTFDENILEKLDEILQTDSLILEKTCDIQSTISFISTISSLDQLVEKVCTIENTSSQILDKTCTILDTDTAILAKVCDIQDTTTEILVGVSSLLDTSTAILQKVCDLEITNTLIFTKVCDILNTDTTILQKACDIEVTTTLILDKVCDIQQTLSLIATPTQLDTILVKVCDIQDTTTEILGKVCTILSTDTAILMKVCDIEVTTTLIFEKVCDIFNTDTQIFTKVSDLEITNTLILEKACTILDTDTAILAKVCDIQDTTTEILVGVSSLLNTETAILQKVCDLEITNTLIFTKVCDIQATLTQQSACATPITQSDIGTLGLTINASGGYVLTENIIFNASVSASAAITINAPNVTLDMQCFSITQGNAIASIHGIIVNSNLARVTIKNSVIINFTGLGILVNDGCSSLILKRNRIFGCLSGGILLQGILSNPIKNPIIKKCSSMLSTGTGGEVFGLELLHTNGGLIKNCVFCENDAGITNNGIGCLLSNCALCTLLNVKARLNAGNLLGIGFDLRLCSNCLLRGCEGNQNTGRAVSASIGAGFRLDQCDRIILKKCLGALNLNANVRANGFIALNGNRNIFERCIAEANSGGTIGAGFELTSEDNTCIFQCASKNNITTTAGIAYGIFLSGTTNNNCDITENHIVHNLGVSASRGIQDARTASTSLVIRNRAFNNGTNYAVTYPVTIPPIVLPLITGSLSLGIPGLPALSAGDLDNISINP